MQRFALLALFAVTLTVGCTQSKVVLGGDDAGMDGGDDGGPITCGTNTCGAGEYCCNESCGTCAPIGAGCAAVECVNECGGEACEPDSGNVCCADCEGNAFCPGPGGACPPIDCPPVCADGTVCEGTCCPSPGCDDGFYCAPPGEPCPAADPAPPICPNTCPDGSACAEGSTCCPGCSGGYFCSSGGVACPDILCPPACDDGVLCETGVCCDDCRGSSYCSPDGACEPCMGECAPYDARGVGECAAFFGYSWNGSECVGISGCDCTGADCDRLFDSPDDCLFEKWSCTGPPSCTSDADCGATDYCDFCATSSCPLCDDCVAGCVPHGCMSEREPTCRAVRPECGPDGIAIVRDGCWVCVDARTCEDLPSDDCRSAGCPMGSSCTACAVGEYICLPDGEACAF